MPARELQIRRDSRLLGELCADLLERGHGVQFRVHGNSMRPNLLSGEQVLVEPGAALRPGDIAFIQNQEGLRVHRVSLVSAQQTLLTRSDTAWEPDAPPTQIFGKVVAHGNNSAEMKTLTTLRTLLLHPVKIAVRKIRLAAKNRFRRAASFLFGTAAILFCASLFAASAHAQADLTMTQVVSVTAVAAGSAAVAPACAAPLSAVPFEGAEVGWLALVFDVGVPVVVAAGGSAFLGLAVHPEPTRIATTKQPNALCRSFI